MAVALGTSSLRQKHLRLPLLLPSSTLNPRWVDSTRPPFPPSLPPLVPSPPARYVLTARRLLGYAKKPPVTRMEGKNANPSPPQAQKVKATGRSCNAVKCKNK